MLSRRCQICCRAPRTWRRQHLIVLICQDAGPKSRPSPSWGPESKCCVERISGLMIRSLSPDGNFTTRLRCNPHLDEWSTTIVNARATVKKNLRCYSPTPRRRCVQCHHICRSSLPSPRYDGPAATTSPWAATNADRRIRTELSRISSLGGFASSATRILYAPHC